MTYVFIYQALERMFQGFSYMSKLLTSFPEIVFAANERKGGVAT